MNPRREVLLGKAAVKGTMLQAHLDWAQKQLGAVGAIARHLDAESADLLTRRTLSTKWIPFRSLIRIDKGIAAAVGGHAEKVFRELGRHSATSNLGGVYKSFVSSEPHRVFTQMGVLHRQFQDFGEWRYAQAGTHAGRIDLQGYSEFSPVYCTSAIGYFEGALKMMQAPGTIVVRETACQCAGDTHCLFELAW